MFNSLIVVIASGDSICHGVNNATSKEVADYPLLSYSRSSFVPGYIGESMSSMARFGMDPDMEKF